MTSELGLGAAIQNYIFSRFHLFRFLFFFFPFFGFDAGLDGFEGASSSLGTQSLA